MCIRLLDVVSDLSEALLLVFVLRNFFLCFTLDSDSCYVLKLTDRSETTGELSPHCFHTQMQSNLLITTPGSPPLPSLPPELPDA